MKPTSQQPNYTYAFNMQPTFTSKTKLSFVGMVSCHFLYPAGLPPYIELETWESRRKKNVCPYIGYPCNLAIQQPSPEPPAGSFAVCKLFMVLRQEEVA